MIIKATPHKVLAPSERTAALAAIATANRKHRHVGIRTKKKREPDTETEGIVVPVGSNSGAGLGEALRKASAAWPDDNSWEVFGSDDFAEFPDDDSCDDTLGDGCFDDPYVYGEFGTIDEPGWMGGYPA